MTTAETHGQVVVREPGTGRGTWAMSSLFEHLLESPPGSERLGVALVTQPPGVATPLHRHTREAEAFYLLDGRMDYRAGDDGLTPEVEIPRWMEVSPRYGLEVVGPPIPE